MRGWRLQDKITCLRSYREDTNSGSSNLKANVPESQGQMSREEERKAELRF